MIVNGLGGWHMSKLLVVSLPDYTAFLKRHRWVRFRYQNERGGSCEKISTGIEAICVEHEVDHLNGVLFIDHVTCLKTDLFPRSLGK